MKLLIDLDGTLLDKNAPTVGAAEFMSDVASRGISFRIITNSIGTPREATRRLEYCGIRVPPEWIFTPVAAINAFVQQKKVQSALIVGSESESAQISVQHDDDSPELIIFLDFEKGNVDYRQLQNIYKHCQNGVPVISASGSGFYQTSNGRQIDTGAFVSMFEFLMSSEIKVFGKPNRSFFQQAFSELGGVASEVMVLGDDWSTDILGAKEAGCRSVLVKTGKYKDGDELKGNPDRLIDSLADFFR